MEAPAAEAEPAPAEEPAAEAMLPPAPLVAETEAAPAEAPIAVAIDAPAALTKATAGTEPAAARIEAPEALAEEIPVAAPVPAMTPPGPPETVASLGTRTRSMSVSDQRRAVLERVRGGQVGERGEVTK